MIKAGIMGATGYAGAEVLRICANHPEFDVSVITSDSEAGQRIVDIYPAFRGVYDELTLEPHTTDSLLSCDVVFMGVPHKAGMLHAPRLVNAGVTCIDLSADFRFANAADYEAAYHVPHAAPELLERATFGQPETNRAALDELAARHAAGEAVIVGCAGCYVTASILAATPALAAGFVDPNAPIIIDAISGITGAGRKPSARTHYCFGDESLEAYGLPLHRHQPEIALSYGRTLSDAHIPVAGDASARPAPAHVIFTPHLAPLKRGILATVYLPLAKDAEVDDASLHRAYENAYAQSNLVTALPQGVWPKTGAVAGTARAHVNASLNQNEHMIVAMAAIDNLGKGAAGQAVQCANIVFGLAEDAGLGGVACAS